MPHGAEERHPFIAVRGVVKRYDGKVVLDDLDLTIERGETVAIIGGSGSGKSTLARILVGLERPTSGSILVDGVDITTLDDLELAAVRRRFAMVFQRHALLDSLSVFDNVAFPLREAEHLPARAVRSRVERVLRELGVEAAAHKLPGELSGGMAKRVGIARAMVMQPELLVYDEPTSGLDPINSRIVDGLIERMRSEHLVTSVVITHDMVTAYRISDRIALLAQGRIVAEGTPEAFLMTHQETVREFAHASGMDVARLGPRDARATPEAVREAWYRAHPQG